MQFSELILTGSKSDLMNGGAMRTSVGGKGKALVQLCAVFLLIIVAGLVTSKVFMNRVSARAFGMNIAPDGKVRWGEVGSERENVQAPVVLFRQVGKSDWYTALLIRP